MPTKLFWNQYRRSDPQRPTTKLFWNHHPHRNGIDEATYINTKARWRLTRERLIKALPSLGPPSIEDIKIWQKIRRWSEFLRLETINLNEYGVRLTVYEAYAHRGPFLKDICFYEYLCLVDFHRIGKGPTSIMQNFCHSTSLWKVAPADGYRSYGRRDSMRSRL